MHDELTKVDIQKMQEEIDYRIQKLRPQLIADVQAARAFGDLSENYEYKVAKQEKNRLVTTLRQDALKGLISKESPVGRALMGRRAGERVEVRVSPELSYGVRILSIQKGQDDASLEISRY